MSRLTPFCIAVAILSLNTLSSAQQAAPNVLPQSGSTELSGKVERLSGETKINKGLEKSKEFSNLEAAMSTIGEKKPFTDEGLEKLKTLLTKSYQTGDPLTLMNNDKPTAQDALVEINFDKDGTTIHFKVSSEDLSRFGSFEDALRKGTQQMCVYVGSCKVCDGKPRGCIIKGFFKSGIRNAVK